MDFGEEMGKPSESVKENTNCLINWDIVKEEYAINDPSVPVQRISENQNEFLKRMKKQKPCYECGKVFTRNVYLKAHTKRMHSGDKLIEKKPLICPVCGRLFKKQIYFDNHIANAHQKYQCSICSQTVRRKWNLTSHMATHDTEKPFACQICNKTFRLERYLEAHSQIHNAAMGEPVKCNYCSNKTFRLERYLEAHSQIHNAAMGEPVKCNYCSNKTFKNTFGLQSHMKYRHRGFPKIPGAAPSCTICKKVCQDMEDLKKHIGTHSIEDRFECAICGLKTRHKYKIAKHIEGVHLKKHADKNVPTTKCPICSKTIRNRKAHMQTHSKERLYSCDICKKSFKRKSNLNSHKLCHNMPNTNKLKKCCYCTKTFSGTSVLRKHMKLRHRGLHRNPEGPPFRCTICKLPHKTLDELKKHIKTHHYFKCAICDRKYVRKRLLEIHIEGVHLKSQGKNRPFSEEHET